MVKIVPASKAEHYSQIHELFLEYLRWIGEKLYETYGMGIDDVEGYVDEDLKHIDKFMPPSGRLFLCFVDDKLAGMGAIKQLAPGIGEIKRMYVRPEFRRQGLGRALMNHLHNEAAQQHYQCLRLDSAPFLPESHQLYRTSGFQDIQPYEGTEVPKEFHKNWIFMERTL